MTRLVILIVILASCTIFLFSCSQSKDTNNRAAVTAKPSPSPSIQQITRPVSTPTLPPPTPKIAMTSVRFRVIGSDGAAAGGVAVVFVESDDVNTVSDAVTDYNGLVSVDEVPCNRSMVLSLWQYGGTRDRFENTKYKRYIKCGKGGVDLGDMKINCLCPDCRAHHGIKSKSVGGYNNKPCP
jgi:hypothetical protein